MSTAAKTATPKVEDAPSIAPAIVDEAATNEAATAAWGKSVIIGVALGFPVVTALLTFLLVTFTPMPTNGAFFISVWVALWMGIFAGGTAGSAAYELRHGGH